MALGLMVGTVLGRELTKATFQGKQDVFFKFAANGSGAAVVTWGEHDGFPLPTMIGCIARADLGQPDRPGIPLTEASGLLVRVVFHSPLDLNSIRPDAVISFTFVREQLTEIAHW